MATVTVLPVAVYPAGAQAVGPVAIGNTVTSLQIAVQRNTLADLTIWPLSTDTIAFDIQVSFDGGVIWQQWFNGSDSGGRHVNKDGSEAQFMYVQGSIAPGTGRQMKATITFSANIKTGATVTVI
jgi:hypothetical protein